MLLAVAGLEDEQVKAKTKQLASQDWSGLHPAERAAFAFARKLSVKPWEVTPEDFELLREHFGTLGALDVVWWTARCQYMTRVADAFQLPLESENVFQRMRAGRNTDATPSKSQ